jgi:hypothetical protein
MTACTPNCSKDGWSGDPDPRVAHNFARDVSTGARICVHCGAAKPLVVELTAQAPGLGDAAAGSS